MKFAVSAPDRVSVCQARDLKPAVRECEAPGIDVNCAIVRQLQDAVSREHLGVPLFRDLHPWGGSELSDRIDE